MTTPTPLPASETYSTELLPRDKFRTLIAVAIVLLTIGGWIYVVMSPTNRSALSAQTRLWWIEQITTFVLAVVCIAIALRKRSFLTLAFWLTIYSLIFKVMRWYFDFRAGEFLIPLALILYALFIWRLQLARRGVAGEGQVVAV
jgi:DMSO reductase anchor subunit